MRHHPTLVAFFCLLPPVYANITPSVSSNGVFTSDFEILVRNHGNPDAEHVHFTVTAQTMFSYNPHRPLYLRREKNLISFRVSTTNILDYSAGDILTVSGFTSPLRHTDPTYLVTNICRIGRSDLHHPAILEADQNLCEALYASQVNVQGIVTSAIKDDIDSNWNWISIKNRSGNIYGAIPDNEYPFHRLCSLVDAEVSVTGLVLRPGNWRNAIGYHLMINGMSLKIIDPPPYSPLNAPSFNGALNGHRKSIKGTVVASTEGLLFVRTTNGLTIPIKPLSGTPMPREGTAILASGFVMPGLLGFQLLEAVIKDDKYAAPLPVMEMTEGSAMDLFSPAIDKRKSIRDSYGKILTATGTVTRIFLNDSSAQLIQLNIGSHQINVDVSNPSFVRSKDITIGCLLSATGICSASFERNVSTLDFPSFRGFTLIPRSNADITILRQSSWITVSRLLIVIGVLTSSIILVLIWNRMLSIRAERRGRELAEEKIISARAESKVEERTRLAVELHDSISQTLTGVALQIDAATTSNLLQSDRGKSYLTTAKLLLSSCRKELECCLWDLRSRTFEEKDMTEAISRTLAPYLGRCLILVRFNVPREALSESAIHSVLNIIRELTANAIRHGHAMHIHIAGEFKEGCVRFSVTDDGSGFDESNVLGPRDGHFGLQGIRERVNDFNGKMDISSKPGKGTKVIVSLMPNLDTTKNA